MAHHRLKPERVENTFTSRSPVDRPDARPTLALVALVAFVAVLVTAGTSMCMTVRGCASRAATQITGAR